VVNNVETLCNVPHIIERGAAWFKGIGPEGSFGPKLFCISGPVKRPGCYEGPMNITLRQLIDDPRFGGGMRDGNRIKAVFPGGISMGVVTAAELDMGMDFASPAKYGLLGLGTAAAVVIDETVDIRAVLRNVARFFALESCGQCTQCREGTSWIYKIASRIERGLGRMDDLALLEEAAGNMGMMPGMSICGLSDGAAYPIKTIVKKFRGELEARIREQRPGRVERALAVLN
jgi:NADH-quinone oxidoreductase subunit F